ncbi:Cytochrome b-c1 complex subunit 9 [Dufourea novaeangliae]|uniref:Cytochrome b-c1 complex subunit 9 n=1 Tax=Dufourea novaeangliae TaxID=178035 RepID=A0A154P5F2_DUFNO|nr:Cytochrome b-c1 complex subunit 9 [Dufourea novaeangliae]
MITKFLYRYVVKRTSTFFLSAVIAAMFFERAVDHACESIFERVNEGRLWMHIKHRYEDKSLQVSHKRKSVEEDASKKKVESNPDKKDNS